MVIIIVLYILTPYLVFNLLLLSFSQLFQVNCLAQKRLSRR